MPVHEHDAMDDAEDIMNEADQDESTDDLTRGTEIYEDEDLEYDDSSEDALDLEPGNYGSGGMGIFEDDAYDFE